MMPDMDRAEVTRFVYDKLADPQFRDRLTAVGPDGDHPIVIAMRDDLMSQVIRDVDAVGRSANVIVPILNGLMAFTMTGWADADGAGADAKNPHDVTALCTVGVFIARIAEDGPASYRFHGDDHVEAGTAELVAVAG